MSALTTGQNLDKKEPFVKQAFPVKSGETIYHNTMVIIDQDGFLKNLTTTNYQTAKMIGIVADDSAMENGPFATTADGAIGSSNRESQSSVIAGDKTWREVWVRGRFLMTFTGTLSQADNGKLAYALNNNDVATLATAGRVIGTVMEVISTSQAYVELNFFYQPNDDTIRILQVWTGVAATTAFAQFSITNPFPGKAIVEEFLIELTAGSTGVAALAAGYGDGSSSDNKLIDALACQGTTGIVSPQVNGGVAGKLPRMLTTGQKVGGTASATMAGLTGFVEVTFRRWIG